MATYQAVGTAGGSAAPRPSTVSVRTFEQDLAVEVGDRSRRVPVDDDDPDPVVDQGPRPAPPACPTQVPRPRRSPAGPHRRGWVPETTSSSLATKSRGWIATGRVEHLGVVVPLRLPVAREWQQQYVAGRSIRRWRPWPRRSRPGSRPRAAGRRRRAARPASAARAARPALRPPATGPPRPRAASAIRATPTRGHGRHGRSAQQQQPRAVAEQAATGHVRGDPADQVRAGPGDQGGQHPDRPAPG